MVQKLLLVGCGITSTVTAKLLTSEFDKISITIWEKLNGPGGRFCTATGDGGKQDEVSIDLGAQYITTTDEKMKSYDDVYSSLLKNNIITLMSNNIRGMKTSQNVKNYVTPCGMTSVVTHFLNGNKFNISYNKKLIALHRHLNKWQALTESGTQEIFDAVILTIPVPEILTLSGDLKTLITEQTCMFEKLKAVNYSSRFALALFFEEGICTEYDSEYITDDSIIRFVAYDSWKNNITNKFYSAAVHTTIQFGEDHCGSDLEVVREIVMKHIYENIFPHWPKPMSVSFCRWDYSQVLSPYDSKPGAITISEEPLLIAGGDGFTGSTFDQCIYSAKTIVKMIANYIECK